MADQKKSPLSEGKNKINRLFETIIEGGYESGFESVQNELREAWDLTFGMGMQKKKGYVEVMVIFWNLKENEPLAEETLKDIVSETAKEFCQKLSDKKVYLDLCRRRTLSFILGIARLKFMGAKKKKATGNEISLDNIQSKKPGDESQYPLDAFSNDVQPEFFDEGAFTSMKAFLLQAKFKTNDIEMLVFKALREEAHIDISLRMGISLVASKQRWKRLKDKLNGMLEKYRLSIRFIRENKVEFKKALEQIAMDWKILFPCQSGLYVTYDEVYNKLQEIPEPYQKIIKLKFFEEEDMDDKRLTRSMGKSIDECQDLLRRALRNMNVLFLRELLR